MALDEIHSRLKANGTYGLLKLLPPTKSMRFVDHDKGTPPKALVIGSWGGQAILAYLIQQGEKPHELRFCTRSRSLLADDIIRMKLMPPFSYIAGPSKSDKWKMSIFIRYYFLDAGVLSDVSADIPEMVKRFQQGLRDIKAQKEEEGANLKKRDVIGETDDEDEEPGKVDEPASPQGVKTRSSRGKFYSPPPSPKVVESDYDRLKSMLEENDELYLLDNIPTAEEMQFVAQALLSEAQPMKLFVGKHIRTGDDVYAYMRYTGNFHEIRFYTESGNSRPLLIAADLFARQQVWHPFSKCYEKGASSIDQGEKARLTLMVKWYFIAAGIAKDCVLKETKDYPNRFRSALQHIAEQMGPAAAKPPTKGQISHSPNDELDESHIQSALGADATSPTNDNHRPQLPTPAASNNTDSNNTDSNNTDSNNTDSNESSRCRKRTAEDAELENLEKIFGEDQKLTKQINDIDDKLDILDMQRQALIEERVKLDDDRKGVRKRLKRQSLVFARMDGDE